MGEPKKRRRGTKDVSQLNKGFLTKIKSQVDELFKNIDGVNAPIFKDTEQALWREKLEALIQSVEQEAVPEIERGEVAPSLRWSALAFHVINRTEARRSFERERDCAVQLLERCLSKGANPNAMGKFWGSFKTSFLIAAANSENDMLVELLLKAGANPNYQDPDGETALHLSAYSVEEDDESDEMVVSRSRVLKITQLLMDAGASTSIKDKSGKTALELIQEQCQERFSPKGLETLGEAILALLERRELHETLKEKPAKKVKKVEAAVAAPVPNRVRI